MMRTYLSRTGVLLAFMTTSLHASPLFNNFCAEPWFCIQKRVGSDRAVCRLNHRKKALCSRMRHMVYQWIHKALVTEKISTPAVQQSVTARPVKVLLAESSLRNSAVEWTLHASSACTIVASNGQLMHTCTNGVVHIAVRNGTVYLNNRSCKHAAVIIQPSSGHIQFGDRMYAGSFMLVHDNEKVYLVNALELEEYICGVLSTESWPGWPLEINKVLAIAARSYVLAMILRNKGSKIPYHIRNTNHHQTYGGAHAHDIHRQAVEQTRGIFLAYKNQPIIAMFDGCCGGIIPAHIADTAFDDAPYLARSYACTHCKRCKIYSWKAEYTLHEFAQKIKKEVKTIGKIKTVHITTKDKAGLVKQVKCKDHKRTVQLTGKKMYSLCKEIKSFCFTITPKADSILIQGRGFGHHLGLCQWGAWEMVREGKEYPYILPFYYPGTTFMKLL
jgi:stage II sporulation protein D